MLMQKPSGRKLKINENSLSFALSLGWKKVKPVKRKPKKAEK